MYQSEETRVLIVEDESLVSEMISGMVEDIGYTVAGRAVDGQQALEMVPPLQPDVVLMDIEMPRMDGIEATRRINSSCPAPVVLLTAYETPELIQKASAAGALAYLVKPPNPQEMERAITITRARFTDMMTLRRLNGELQTRNQELDAFSHTVAHDLRGPLHLIRGYARLLKEQARLQEGLEEYLNNIVRYGYKMETIIEELLLLATVQQSSVELKPLNMGRILAEAQQRLQPTIEQYQAQVIIPSAWPVALGHAPWVEAIWTNYLSNAIKYGGQPPRIHVGATACSDGQIRFWVRDNGSGLTPEQQRSLFKPFTRLGKFPVEGHGLGLSIVQHIVEKLGGKVGIKSEGAAGKGCTFYFTLSSMDGRKPGI